MKRKNVHLVTDKVIRLSSDSVITKELTLKPDVLIYGTGFKSLEILAPVVDKIQGKNQTLSTFWGDYPRAFRGMTVPTFPNLFILYGPNINLGHNSIIFMIECQVDYIIKILSKMHTKNAASVQVSQKVFDDHNEQVQEDLKHKVWSGGCTSWYKKEGGK